jgi:benzoylformate decarboxylase
MFSLSRALLDRKIDRRRFLTRLTQAGVSLAGAEAIADSLAAEPLAPGGSAHPAPSRTLTGLTGGEAVAEFLLEWRVPYVFGLAGSEETGLLDAFVDRPALRYVTCLHENAAMAMADGYSRSTGDTSIVQLHSIAGVAYALGQMAGSFLDRIPVVVMAGCQSTNFRGENGFLDSPNLNTVPREYARWTWDVVNAGTLTEVLRRAFLLAEAPPGGPTFVTVSKDLFEQRLASTEIVPRSRSRVQRDVPPPEGHVERIVESLLAAEAPTLYLGNECIRHEISQEVAGIAEAVGAMVMLSVKIPCVFPNTHPNFVGEVLDDPDLLPGIDCFWSLGANMFQTFNRPPQPLIKRQATILHTSLVPDEVGRNYPVDGAAIASIKAACGLVLKALQSRDLDRSAIRARQARLSAYTEARRRRFEAEAKAEWDQTPIATSRLMSELDRVIAPDAEVVSELISSDTYPRRYLRFDHTVPPARRRRQHYTTSGVLGWGVAAAIGTKIGRPHKEVWCLTGDGSFNFGCQALWSAARYEVPVGVVVFNNGQYQANRQNQNLYRGRMYQTGRYVGVNLGHPDIDHVKIAQGYGVEGERVTSPGALAEALARCQRAMSAGRPYLLDVKIERQFEGKDSDWHDFFSVARGDGQRT